MCGLKWGDLYEQFHKTAYNAAKMGKRASELMADDSVSDKRRIFENLLGGETGTKLLNVRAFKPTEAKAVYRRQTDTPNKQGISNCLLCSIGHAATATRILDFKGGATTAANCQMLCKTHNRANSNR